VAAFVSSVAGGVAATGWFLFRSIVSTKAVSPPSSDQLPQAKGKDEGWPNPFSDLASGGNERHPSWSASGGSKEKGSGGVESKAKGTPKGNGEKAQQGVGCDHEHEAGVWVGWGGGCAF